MDVETYETYEAPPKPDPVADSKRSSQGGKARAKSLTPERRREIASAASISVVGT